MTDLRMDLPSDTGLPTLPAVLMRAVEQFENSVFVVDPFGRLTFTDLATRADELARRLILSGIGKGTRVGALLPSGIDWVVTWAACGQIGALFMPLSTLYTPQECTRVLRLGDVHTLVVPDVLFNEKIDRVLATLLPSGLHSESANWLSGGSEPVESKGLPYLRRILVCGDGHEQVKVVQAHAQRVPEAINLVERMAAHVTPADELITIFTSGTTAQAKAVVHTHGGVFRKAKSSGIPGVPQPGGGPTFVGMPFFWVGGLSIVASALHSGVTLVCQDKFDVDGAIEMMEMEGVTQVIAWPTTMARLRSDPRVHRSDLASIPALAPPAIERALTHNSLGMTETIGPHTGGARAGAPDEERQAPLPERLRGSWGAPLPGVEHRVVDRDGAHLPDGTIGELKVRGEGVMARLYKKERHETFDEDGWYSTGDLAEFRDGYLYFLGRMGDMIKVRGANVSPREVEVALESLPGISTAVVVGLSDSEGEEEVAALIVTDADEIDLTTVRDGLRPLVSSYKVPVKFLSWENELPMLPSGKPDRRAITKILENASL